MRFTPFTKRIEVDAGYRAFYTTEKEKFEVHVIENGIKVTIISKSSLINGLPVVRQYFKPILNLMTALEYAKSLGELNEGGYSAKGFVLVADLSIA